MRGAHGRYRYHPRCCGAANPYLSVIGQRSDARKDDHMTLLSHLRNALALRRAYRRTVWELRGVAAGPLAEDVGVYPGDAKRLAREAVYG